jgi:hypothetical protein
LGVAALGSLALLAVLLLAAGAMFLNSRRSYIKWKQGRADGDIA